MAAVEAVEPAPVAAVPEDVEMTVAEAGTSEANGIAANTNDTDASTDEADKAKALKQSKPLQHLCLSDHADRVPYLENSRILLCRL